VKIQPQWAVTPGKQTTKKEGIKTTDKIALRKINNENIQF
jgi:hypothetical protein